jgi:hypothetical protein
MYDVKYLKYKNRYIMLSFILLFQQSNIYHKYHNKLCHLMTLADMLNMLILQIFILQCFA